MTQTKELNSIESILTFHHSKFIQGNLPLQKNLWVKSREKGAKTIINKCFQGYKEPNKFELKFILLYWGLIGIDFGFFNLSNASIDRLKVPKYPFKAPNKQCRLYPQILL